MSKIEKTKRESNSLWLLHEKKFSDIMTKMYLAVMGRLAEIGVIEWSINQDSISEYYMLE